MGDVLFLGFMLLILWIVYAVVSKKSIIPFLYKKGTEETIPQVNKKRKNEQVYVEEEPDIFENLLDDLIGIKNHLVHLKNNRFLLFAEVTPCNYFLRSQEEQEAIDAVFETWLATINYNVQWYLQNRYIDLSEPIDEMRKNMLKADDIPLNAIEYGKSMLEDLIHWQSSQPRYETKRYIIFPFEVKVSNIDASQEEFRERVEEKAWSELFRRFNNAKSTLRRANMEVELLTTEGIIDVFYHLFNRKKALKSKFKNIRDREMLSLYSTADQPQSRVELVKELISQNENI